jgi:hypothetical protein
MTSYKDTRLWRETLGLESDKGDEPNPSARLRNTYFIFRERAAHIAGEIAISLPEFTVHDVTHLDALWEMADLIAGPKYILTPAEAFVLGGAFLIHDLGNGLAAYPMGKEDLRRDPAWPDAVAVLLKRKLGRNPKPEEIQNPDKDVEVEAIGQVLRNLHAKHAERLARTSWKDREKDEEYHLIEDTDLRRTYGRIIGKIAHSHWWDVDSLGKTFTSILNPPPGFPRDWTVDPLKIACLLRVADASHLDTRRAPGFLRALRKPTDSSRAHWIFQENLQQPRIDGDRLVYTSGDHFSIEDAPAWWLCFDTLQMVDRELKEVDALLADSGRDRFLARGVAGAEEPGRLVKWVPTDNWIPVDTKIRVSNVASLVRDLGGEQLYGENKTVPLRELIQNAADAIRARRIIDKRSADYGEVIVRLGRDSEGHWIEIEDNGVGMTPPILTGPFIDFGTSFWGSSLMLREFPGLAAKGFESTGRYGVGFFSVFMWGERVRVTTRPSKEALHNTQVLEFDGGLGSRPILRAAEDHEFIRDGGTIVRVWLKDDPESFSGVLSPASEESQTLEELCASLCPSLDVNLYTQRSNEEQKLVVAASDWITIDASDLAARLQVKLSDLNKRRKRKRRAGGRTDEDLALLNKAFSRNMRLMRDHSGAYVGRACITGGKYGLDNEDIALTGIVSVGGFRASELSGIAGILLGTSLRASRDAAVPFIGGDELAAWASEQAVLLAESINDAELLNNCAMTIRRCGGNTGRLPIAETSRGWISVEDIYKWEDLPDEIFLVQDAALWLKRREVGAFTLNDNVMVSNPGSPSIVMGRSFNFHSRWPKLRESPWRSIPGKEYSLEQETLEGLLVETLAKVWSAQLEDVVKVSNFYKDDEEETLCEVGKKGSTPIKLAARAIINPNKTS